MQVMQVDRKRFEIWLVTYKRYRSREKEERLANEIRLSKQFSFKNIHWYSNAECDKYSRLILSCQVVIIQIINALYMNYYEHYLLLLPEVIQNKFS